MFGLETIIAMNKAAGDKAREGSLEPYLLEDPAQLDTMPPFPFPNIGDDSVEVDKRLERITSLFCDKSGFGAPDEPALTMNQLMSTLTELLEEHGPLRLAIEEEGQFQLYIGVWK